MEEIWIVGDEFVTRSSFTHFTERTFDSYTKSNYEVSTVSSSEMATNVAELKKVCNMVARIINTLNYALFQKAKLPKMMIFVLEDDVIRYLKYNDYGVTEMFGKIIDYLSKNIRKVIDDFKAILPTKAKRVELPQLVWILPTTHRNYFNNNLRKKFCQEMENIINFQRDSCTLKLRQVWDARNADFVSPTRHRITHEGTKNLWEAVDRTIRYADWKLFKEKDALMLRLYLQYQRECDEFTSEDSSRDSRERDQPQDSTQYNASLKR